MTWAKKLVSDRLWLSAVGVVAVFVVAVAHLFAEVLDAPLTEQPIIVEVELARTGGLFEGSAVTYRGVKIGTVETIAPRRGGGALATARLRGDTEVPAASMARVRSLSPVGEQYLDFRPASSDGPYLADGDTISAESVDLPTSLPATFVAVNEVLSQIDDEKLKVLLTELSTGLAGTGDDLGRILDQGQDLLATLDRVWPETDRVITNADTVLDIGSDNADTLRSLGRNARQFAAFLADYSTEFEGVLAETPRNLRSLEELVVRASEYVPQFLATGAEFASMFRPWNSHLRTLLQEYPRGVATVTRLLAGGVLSLNAVTADTARCGYDTERHPSTRLGTSFQRGGGCPATFARLQRGAAHAPGPDQ